MSAADLFSYVAPPGPRARFDGACISVEDEPRLTGQILRVKAVIGDQKWRTVQEIAALTGDPQNSVAAQLRNLRKGRFGAFEVPRRLKPGTSATYEFRLGAAGAADLGKRDRLVSELRARIRELEAQLGVER